MTPWRRDAVPAQVCRCEHDFEFHRHDLKAHPCRSCACVSFALFAFRWRETRYVTEEVQP